MGPRDTTGSLGDLEREQQPNASGAGSIAMSLPGVAVSRVADRPQISVKMRCKLPVSQTLHMHAHVMLTTALEGVDV